MNVRAEDFQSALEDFYYELMLHLILPTPYPAYFPRTESSFESAQEYIIFLYKENTRTYTTKQIKKKHILTTRRPIDINLETIYYIELIKQKCLRYRNLH